MTSALSLSRFTAVAIFAYAPLLVVFFLNLWPREPYQFFPLAVVAAVYLARRAVRDQRSEIRDQTPASPQERGIHAASTLSRPKVEPSPSSKLRAPSSAIHGPTEAPKHRSTEPPPSDPTSVPSPHSSFFLLPSSFSLALLATATILWSPWLAAIAALFGLIALTFRRGGWQLFVAMIPALLMLLIIIPPPLNLDAKLTLALRALAVRWSSPMLDLLGVTHVITGNLIEIPGRQLLVAEACSGINSILSTLAACLFYLLLRRRSVIQSIFALASTVIFVLLGNVARFTLGAWLLFRFHFDILSGGWHPIFGLVLFVSYLVLILSFDQLWLFLTIASKTKRRIRWTDDPASAITETPKHHPTETPKHRSTEPPPSELTSGPEPPKRSSTETPKHRNTVLLSLALLLLFLAQLAQGYIHIRKTQVEEAIPQSNLRAGATFSMPDQIGDWQRLSTSPAPTLQKVETMGVYSQIWHYRNGPLVVSVALDYPFRGYHDVTVCYSGQGWQFLGLSAHPGEGPQNKGSSVEVLMQKGFLKSGTLYYSTIDQFGNWPDGSAVKRSFRDRFKIGTADPITYRIQALVTGYTPLPDPDRAQVTAFFAQARELLVSQLFNQLLPR